MSHTLLASTDTASGLWTTPTSAAARPAPVGVVPSPRNPWGSLPAMPDLSGPVRRRTPAGAPADRGGPGPRVGVAARPGVGRDRVRGVVGVWSTRFNAGELGAMHAGVRTRRRMYGRSGAHGGGPAHLLQRSDQPS
ncbi:hypothetical protein Scel_68780 [Streptomyces cellostaticus]|nr:hypothetical protein Scel_68780 [Streptomyces cellostaticus]